MKRLLISAPLLLCAVNFTFAQLVAPEHQAQLDRVAILPQPPMPQRIVTGKTIFVGKVTAIEPKSVIAEIAPGSKAEARYQVAVVAIKEGIQGVNGVTSVRLGFNPVVIPKKIAAPGKAERKRPYPVSTRQVPISVGVEALFFLKRHHKETFFVTEAYYDVMTRQSNPNFDRDVALLKRCLKVRRDPMSYLRSEKSSDRLLAVSVLLAEYNTPPVGAKQVRRVPIDDAEKSKLILEALAKADWNNWRKPDPETNLSVVALFNYLRLTPADGWRPRFRDYNKEFPVAAQKWLRDNAGKYRVQRYVADE
ncbi:MAG: hypothetical protein KatS3mg105_1582 [Gemmatales bacterium]|nr:MAG: hypothetical protein KatS3mg105_1582 [Gemmatales bacterium]